MLSVSEELAALSRRNPGATPQDLADAIIQYVEETLTETYHNLSLPATQPPVSAKLEELMLRRLPMRRRSRTKDRSETRNKVLSELYRIHFQLDGWAVANDTTRHYSPIDTDSTLTREDLPDGFPSLTSNPITHLTSTADQTKTPQDPERLPYSPSQMTSMTRNVLSFQYGNKWKDLLRNPRYDFIASTLERYVREFAENSDCLWRFKLDEEPDAEIPSWTRNVLRVSIESADFEEQIKLWDQLDRSLRDHFRTTFAKSPDQQADAEQFIKHLFLKIDTS